MEGTQFRYVIKFVSDMNKAVKFYVIFSVSDLNSNRSAGANS
jgi:hypothetical protein